MVFTRRQSKATKENGEDCAQSNPSKLNIEKPLVESTRARKTAGYDATHKGVSDDGADIVSVLQSKHLTPDTTPVRSSAYDKHPCSHQKTTTIPYGEAQWLGFSNMQPQTEPRRVGSKIHHAIPGSPTPIKTLPHADFTFRREASLGLSPDAKAIVAGNREVAARIRAQLVGEAKMRADSNAGLAPTAGRKIARPRGRFSDAHSTIFDKMAPITNHPSVWRKQPGHQTTKHTGVSFKPASQTDMQSSPLKRNRSKLDLTPAINDVSNQVTAHKKSAVASEVNIPDAKRAKKNINDDVGTSRPVSHDSSSEITNVPSKRFGYPSKLSTPTKSSLARAKSYSNISASRLPTLARAPSSTSLRKPCGNLTRKAGISDLHASAFKETAANTFLERPSSSSSCASGIQRSLDVSDVNLLHTPKSAIIRPEHLSLAPTPSPLKTYQVQIEGAVAFPQLKSPEPELELTKLRSILRTPQRLYSKDPNKIAAGTHHATPPESGVNRTLFAPPASVPFFKHVDFSPTALMKAARDEAKAASVEPEVVYDTPVMDKSRRRTMAFASEPGDFTFRAGTPIIFGPAAGNTIRQVQPTDDDARQNDSLLRKRPAATTAISPYKSALDHQETDKENGPNIHQDHRPSKRLRMTNTNIVQKVKSAIKKSRTTPSVSSTSSLRIPKHVAGGSVSVARLAVLAQPKKRIQ